MRRNLWLSLSAIVIAYLLVGLLASLSVFARRDPWSV